MWWNMNVVQIALNLSRRLYSLFFSSVRRGAEVCLFVLIALIVVEVFSRYVLNKPTLIAYELSSYLLVGITYLALAYGLQQGSHIRVTIFVDCLPGRLHKWWALIFDSIVLVCIIVLMWKSIGLVLMSFESGVRLATYLRTPLWIPQALVPIGLGMFVMEALRQLVVQAKGLQKARR